METFVMEHPTDSAPERRCKFCSHSGGTLDSKGVCRQCNANDKSGFLPNYMNLWQLPEGCKVCTFPMHIASGKDKKICPNCNNDDMFATDSRKTLDALKQLWFRLHPPELKKGNDETGREMFGMPL